MCLVEMRFYTRKFKSEPVSGCWIYITGFELQVSGCSRSDYSPKDSNSGHRMISRLWWRLYIEPQRHQAHKEFHKKDLSLSKLCIFLVLIFFQVVSCIEHKKTRDRPTVDPGYEKDRRRPTLPLGFPSSTIGAKELNFRVRDGNGCRLFAIATENYKSYFVFGV